MLITWEEWIEQYNPIENGRMFETYGKDKELVANTQNEYVWTLVDVEDEDMIISGKHFVNRIGYYICEIPWSGQWQIIVELED